MRVAIIDDAPEDLAQAVDYFTNYISKNHIELSYNLKVKTYSDALDFIKNTLAEQFDLVILDICMGEINGVQLAQFIRDKDKNCEIIFLTNSDEFLLDGYQVFAAGYFIKPIGEHAAEFNRTFNFIYPKLLAKHQEIKIPLMKHSEITIPYQKILYCEINDKHRLCIHTKNEDYVTSMSYENCQKWLLTDARFLECYYRIIVNMDYIISMKEDDFWLEGGQRVPISSRRKKEAKLQYMQYLANRD